MEHGIYAKDQYNEKAEQLGGIGFMASSFHGDSYFISVAVGATTFSHLLKCDRLNDKIVITICGLGHESGSSIFLKNLDESVLVTEVAFSVPLFDKSAPTEDVSRDGDLQSWQRIIIMLLGVISVAVVTIAFKLLSS